MPFIRGCKETATQGGQQPLTPSPPAPPSPPSAPSRPSPADQQQGNSTSISTEIVFPSPGDAESPYRVCPPGTGKGTRRPGSGTPGDHGEDADRQLDIDIRIVNRPPTEENAEGSATRQPCRDRTTAEAVSVSEAHVSTLLSGPPRGRPVTPSGARLPPGAGRAKHTRRPGHRRQGAAAGDRRRRPQPKSRTLFAW